MIKEEEPTIEEIQITKEAEDFVIEESVLPLKEMDDLLLSSSDHDE